MDAPKLLADQGACQDRRAALAQPHVAPLASFVDRLRRQQRGSRVPDFDPWDGGVQAECLFLLEAPGPKSVASGFVSRNNPDETAKNFFELNHEAGLSRSRTITWNVVPSYVGDESRIGLSPQPTSTRRHHISQNCCASCLGCAPWFFSAGRLSVYVASSRLCPNVLNSLTAHTQAHCRSTGGRNAVVKFGVVSTR